jgi:hypothetical protein
MIPCIVYFQIIITMFDLVAMFDLSYQNEFHRVSVSNGTVALSGRQTAEQLSFNDMESSQLTRVTGTVVSDW